MAVFIVGFIVGACVVAVVSIAFPPSRRVWRERVMDDEEETRVLLGLEPEPEQRSEPAVHPREYDTSELAALRALDQERRTGRKGS